MSRIHWIFESDVRHNRKKSTAKMLTVDLLVCTIFSKVAIEQNSRLGFPKYVNKRCVVIYAVDLTAL